MRRRRCCSGGGGTVGQCSSGAAGTHKNLRTTAGEDGFNPSCIMEQVAGVPQTAQKRRGKQRLAGELEWHNRRQCVWWACAGLPCRPLCECACVWGIYCWLSGTKGAMALPVLRPAADVALD